MENLESSSRDAIERARLGIQGKYVKLGVDLILLSTAEDNAEKAEKLADISRRLDMITQELRAKAKSA